MVEVSIKFGGCDQRTRDQIPMYFFVRRSGESAFPHNEILYYSVSQQASLLFTITRRVFTIRAHKVTVWM